MNVFRLKNIWRIFKGYNPYSLVIRFLLFLDSRQSGYQEKVAAWACRKYCSSFSFCKKIFFICLILFSVEVSLSAKVGLSGNSQQGLSLLTAKTNTVLTIAKQLPEKAKEAAVNLAVMLPAFLLPILVLIKEIYTVEIIGIPLGHVFSEGGNISSHGPPHYAKEYSALDNNLIILGKQALFLGAFFIRSPLENPTILEWVMKAAQYQPLTNLRLKSLGSHRLVIDGGGKYKKGSMFFTGGR